MAVTLVIKLIMDEFKKGIEFSLNNLNHLKKILFIAFTCEKMFPTYVKFSIEVNWGDSTIFEQCITMLYQIILGQRLGKEEVSKMLETFDAVIPGTIDFVTASYATDSCIAMYEGLLYLQTKKIEHALNVSSTSINMIDMYVQDLLNLESTDPLLEEKIANDKHMKNEQTRQIEIINELKKVDVITPEVISLLRIINNSYYTYDINKIS